MRAAIAAVDRGARRALLLRALEIYEVDRLGFAEVLSDCERGGDRRGRGMSFDRAIDRVRTVERVEP